MRRVALLGLLVLASSEACSPRVRRTPDDILVYVLEQNIQELDPRYVVGSQETKVSRLVAPGLVSVDQPSMEPIMELAAGVDSIDPLTWDATLRDDVRFSDGTPMTSRDVVYTYRSVLDPATQSAQFRQYDERLVSVEALDDRRVRFHLKQPLATLVTDLDLGIVEAAEAERHGGRWPNGEVAGAGAYHIARLVPNETTLERNEHYFRGPAKMRRIVFRTMFDTNARLLVLVGGSADMALNGVRLDLVASVAAKPRLKIESAPSAILTYLMMKNDDPLLADPRVRRAIAFAIDRDKIIRGKLGGRAVPATGLVPPGHWAYSGDVDRYPYDPARARALLDEAGFKDPDGPGPRPRFSLVYKTSSDGMRVAIARLIAQDLGDVGIAVDVRSFEFATFFADVKRGNYQLAALQTGEIAEPDMYLTYFASWRIPTPAMPDLANRSHYRSADADRLIDEGRHELDRAKRKTIYAELQRIMARDVPVVPLWHEDNIAVLNRDVMGFEVLPTARLPSLARVWKEKH